MPKQTTEALRPDTTSSEVAGTVMKVIQRFADSGNVVAVLSGGETVKGLDEDEQIVAGASFRFMGRYTHHPKWGRQFFFTLFVPHLPTDRSGIVRYVAKYCPGIGPVKAGRLYDKFAGDLPRMLRENNRDVLAESIIDEATLAAASEALKPMADYEATVVDLFGLMSGGRFPQRAMKEAIKLWGIRAPSIIRRNPFALLVASIWGCSFARCDELYRKQRLPLNRLKRVMLCAWSVMQKSNSGNTWFPYHVLRSEVANAIGDSGRLNRAIKLGIKSKWLAHRIHDDGVHYFAEWKKSQDEKAVAAFVSASHNSPPAWPTQKIVADKRLSESQRLQVAAALKSCVCVLSGTPGTGKTYTTAVIIDHVVRAFGLSTVAVVAPTGKAAVRISDALKSNGVEVTATTVHRFMFRTESIGPSYVKDSSINPRIKERFIFVEEASMMDAQMANWLLSECAPTTHVMFIGDPYQLPPVGHGAPLRDLITSKAVPNGKLTEIMRNDGLVVRACAAIKDNRRPTFMPPQNVNYESPGQNNLIHFPEHSAEKIVRRLTSVIQEIQAHESINPVWDVQVLVAVNNKSPLSRSVINAILQHHLNPTGRQCDGNKFRVGDKIICLKNRMFEPYMLVDFDTENGTNQPAFADCFVANGDIGCVLAVESSFTVAEFYNPSRKFRIPVQRDTSQNELDEATGVDFDLAYAITAHKSQGSEFAYVITLIDDYGGANMVCSREWWYTATSRVKRLGIVIGNINTLIKQCRRSVLNDRRTFLAELLSGTLKEPANDLP